MITRISSSKLANKKYLLAKAFDNRVGIGVVLEVLELLQIPIIRTFSMGGNCGGSRTAGSTDFELSRRSDIGVSIDHDRHRLSRRQQRSLPRQGPSDGLRQFHGRACSLREHIMSIAEEKIPFQLSYLNRGGTDRQNSPCESDAPVSPSASPGYIHPHTSIIHQDDYDQTVRLVHELLKVLTGHR